MFQKEFVDYAQRIRTNRSGDEGNTSDMISARHTRLHDCFNETIGCALVVVLDNDPQKTLAIVNRSEGAFKNLNDNLMTSHFQSLSLLEHFSSKDNKGGEEKKRKTKQHLTFSCLKSVIF